MKNNDFVTVWTANGNVYLFNNRSDAEDFLELLVEEYGENTPYADAMIVEPYDRR